MIEGSTLVRTSIYKKLKKEWRLSYEDKDEQEVLDKL
jgi:hypothetical protein